MPRRVLAPIYGSERTPRIIDEACELAQDGLLVLAHIVDTSFLASLPGAAHVPDSTEQGLENLGRRLLEAKQEEVSQRGVECRTALRHGKLLPEITELIREYEIDTIVVGAHKRAFLEAEHEKDWAKVKEETGVDVRIVE